MEELSNQSKMLESYKYLFVIVLAFSLARFNLEDLNPIEDKLVFIESKETTPDSSKFVTIDLGMETETVKIRDKFILKDYEANILFDYLEEGSMYKVVLLKEIPFLTDKKQILECEFRGRKYIKKKHRGT